MSYNALEAIILKVVPFEEHSHIVTLFSKEYGKVTLITKRGQKTKGLSPLLLVEAEAHVSEKEIWKAHHFEVINSFPQLRLKLDILRHAAGACQFLAHTLPIHAKSLELYSHFLEFLQKLSFFTLPHVASSALLAKFCLLEGLLGGDLPLCKEEQLTCHMLAYEPFETLYKVVCEEALLKKLVVIATR